MYCTHCGSVNSAEDTFCRKCGASQQPQVRPSVAVGAPAATALPHLAVPLAAVGFFVGGLIGFMMRPSAILIGQLPFGTVITRGANLTGLDTLLRSTAENSFNQMFTAAVVGALAAGIVGFLIKTQPAGRA